MSLSTTAINYRHASHRHGLGSTAGFHQKRSVVCSCAWAMDYHVWSLMLEAYHKLHPKPKSITEHKEALQVIWDSLPQEPINQTV